MLRRTERWALLPAAATRVSPLQCPASFLDDDSQALFLSQQSWDTNGQVEIHKASPGLGWNWHSLPSANTPQARAFTCDPAVTLGTAAFSATTDRVPATLKELTHMSWGGSLKGPANHCKKRLQLSDYSAPKFPSCGWVSHIPVVTLLFHSFHHESLCSRMWM